MLIRNIAVVAKPHCVACGCCTRVCPKNAITIYKGMYAIVSTACVGCGKCAAACPAGIIGIAAKEEARA